MKTNTYKSRTLLSGFLFLVFAQVSSAQNYTDVMNTPFVGVAASSVAFADVDGDGDQDVLMTGATLNDRISRLYTNDGSGNFTEVPDTPFEGVAFSSIAFADVDGDGDLDLLLTGASLFNLHSIMYINDGSGNFSALPDTPFEPMNNGSVAFVDVDGDGDQDVLMTGQNLSLTNHISKLYLNDGTGSFSEMMNTPFVGTIYSSMSFADIDGDNDQDVLITGQDDDLDPISKLYTNDGSGNFTEVMDTPFEGVSEGSIAFGDVDGDNDQDVLITGSFSSKLYTNDGSGNFTEELDTPFDQVYQSSIAFADVDGDNDQDVFITGENISYNRIAKLYINDGSGSFSEAPDTPFDGVDESSIAIDDVDGDSDLDLLITGLGSGSLGHISKLYINDGVLSSGDDLPRDANLKLTPFPNPAVSNNLNLRFESTESRNVLVRIYDVKGNLISQQNEFTGIGEQIVEIEISALTPGTYFIQLENGGKLGMAKFIVE
jgi:hypothetical protein